MSKAERRPQAIVQLDQEHAVRDSIPEKLAVQRRLEGEFRITHILILDRYLEWLKDRNLPVYSDEDLRPLDNLFHEYPFNGGHFPQNYSLLIAAFSREYWRLFVAETDIEADLTSVLGIPPRLFQQLSTLRLQLVRRHHTPNYRK
ncbi:hypothetical protein Aura_00155 [Pseudomonas phage vB_PpuM-Aura]